MHLPRVRFTVRQLMAAVTVLALVLAVVDQLRRRRESFQQRAKVCRQKVCDAYMDEQSARTTNRFDYDPRTTAAYYQLIEYYGALRVKYERAAAHPWWFVGPDPPEPVWPRGVRQWEGPKGMPWRSSIR
jgi:hypothetical protein